VYTLNISGCDGIRDVSALGNVHTLSMRYCDEIRDVSALGNVHTLDISCCGEISDVSTVYALSIFLLSLRPSEVPSEICRAQ
jgi:hypothetical protein